MKRMNVAVLALTALMLLGLLFFPATSAQANSSARPAGQIYLYGEAHAVEAILKKELEIWSDCYHQEGIRHLFIESAYYTAEFLNLWMQEDSDDILNQIYDDWVGKASHDPAVKAFYQQIKRDCPQTIFHGTDIGHEYESTGQRFLIYLEKNGMKESKRYLLAKENIEQGINFFKKRDFAYRENMMTENFIRAFDALDGESVMGIYGRAHTGLEEMDFSGAVPSMANQLKQHYGDIVYSQDLSWIKEDIEPLRIDKIELNGKTYEASYFGQQDLTGFKDYTKREYWRLEKAWEDFKDHPKSGDVLPYYKYPMLIEAGQIFMIDYTKTDGSVTRTYYRSDGNHWNGFLTTEQFILEQ